MKKQFDYIIVGQGIAGTLLAWFLQKQGKSFVIIDKFNPSSSSQVSAGIIHPITGRRIVKTWMADTLIPFAENIYKEIGESLSINFFHPLPVLYLIENAKEYNDWSARSESPGMKEYISMGTDKKKRYDNFLSPSFFSEIIIHHTGWINTKLFLQSCRKYFSQKEKVIDEVFDHDLLKLKDIGVRYGEIEARKIIFCEGFGAMKNPFWKSLPFLPAKGEMLTIRCEADIEHIITKKIFILPLGNHLFKVGSTYNWKDLTEVPTEDAKYYLTDQLKEIIKVPFEIINHEASVRPAAKDRRPFLGFHPTYNNVGIFNGLGTKGFLLAPYFAHHFTEFLLGKNKLMKEVDVSQHFASTN